VDANTRSYTPNNSLIIFIIKGYGCDVKGMSSGYGCDVKGMSSGHGFDVKGMSSGYGW
jgi:hypothetical protein